LQFASCFAALPVQANITAMFNHSVYLIRLIIQTPVQSFPALYLHRVGALMQKLSLIFALTAEHNRAYTWGSFTLNPPP